MNESQIGLQLWSVRGPIKENYAAALDGVAKAGFRLVEPFAGWGGVSASQLKDLLDERGLRRVSTHTSWQAFNEGWAQLQADARELGLTYLFLAATPKDRCGSKEDCLKLGQEFEAVGRKVRDAGFRFGIHNHAWEWAEIDGSRAIDWMLEPASPENVLFELDTFHTWETGADPVDYLRKYADRVELVHFKDGTDSGVADFGDGQLDFERYRDAADAIGVKRYILEYGEQKPAQLESVASGYQRAKALCNA